jgi:biotin carboxylase
MDDTRTRLDPELVGKRLLILGAGLWQTEYIRHARRLGVETWVTDWAPDAVGSRCADHFEPIDVRHVDKTIAFARRGRVDGVLTSADVAVPTAARVAAELSLPGYSRQLALEATNKLHMRRRSASLGIAGPAFQPVTSREHAKALMASTPFPVIVKPVDSCSSRGVRYVSETGDFMSAVEQALKASRTGEAIVEEFLVGTEGSIEALVENGTVHILGFCDKTKSALPYRFDLELRYPGAFQASTQAEIERLARTIAGGFGLQSGIMHIEFLVSDETRRVHLIEFAIRGCGSKVVTHLMPAMTEVDVIRVLVRQALGLHTAIPADPRRSSHGALHFLMFPPGRVAAVRGLDEAMRVPGVVDVCIERQPGEVIEPVQDGRSRPGHVLVTGNTRRSAQEAIEQVRALLRIDYEHVQGVAAS